MSKRVYWQPFLIAMFGMFGQQFCGINVVFFYQQTIFEKAHSSIDPSKYWKHTYGLRIISKGCANIITNFSFNSCGCIFGCRCPMLWNWRSGLHCRQIWPQNFTDIVQCFHGFTPGCTWNLFLLGWKSNLLWKWYPTFPGPKCMAQVDFIFEIEMSEKYIFFSSDLGFRTSPMARSFETIHQIGWK